MSPCTRIARRALGWSAAAALAFGAPAALASSHSDAPLISQDPQANTTDVYAFVGTRYDDASQPMLNVLVQVRPFAEPGNGPGYHRFADDVLYTINITDPSTGETNLRYEFDFSDVNPSGTPGLQNPCTTLTYGRASGGFPDPITSLQGGARNYLQTYRVFRRGTGPGATMVTSGALTPPPNLGPRTTPFYNDSAGRATSGATSFAELDAYTQQAITDTTSGEVFFAGPREDGFYADMAALSDLIDVRVFDNDGDFGDGLGLDGGGPDTFKGYNVLAYAVQIPLSSLTPGSYTAPVTGAPSTGVGVYATAERRRITLRGTDREALNVGAYVPVSRMGNPLFNQSFVHIGDKDRYNRTAPPDDASNFGSYALNPDPARLLKLLHPPFAGTQESGRSDLFQIYIPDILKVDTTTGPVRLPGQAGFSSRGFFGNDTVGGQSGGWPNGRRIGDDVVDVALTALANGPDFSSFQVIGDNVAANDQIYHQVFPYLATPHSGSNHSHD